MLNNKTKFLIVICIILVLVTVVLNFLAMCKKNAQPEPATNEQPSANNPATLPPATSSRDNNYVIKKESSLNETEAAFKRFVSERASKELAGAQFVDQQGKLISLKDLRQSLAFELPSDLNNLVNNNNYNIYYCARGTEKQLGLILYLVPPTSSKEVSNMNKAKEKMKNWEPNLLKDLHNLLFPNVIFSPEQLNQTLQFKDGKFRFAEVVLPGGAKGSLNYKFYGDPLVIASSPDCLQKAEDYYFDIEAE